MITIVNILVNMVGSLPAARGESSPSWQKQTKSLMRARSLREMSDVSEGGRKFRKNRLLWKPASAGRMSVKLSALKGRCQSISWDRLQTHWAYRCEVWLTLKLEWKIFKRRKTSYDSLSLSPVSGWLLIHLYPKMKQFNFRQFFLPGMGRPVSSDVGFGSGGG